MRAKEREREELLEAQNVEIKASCDHNLGGEN